MINKIIDIKICKDLLSDIGIKIKGIRIKGINKIPTIEFATLIE